MSILSLAVLVLVSCFALGFYNHYAADCFAFNICLRDNIKLVTKAAVKLVRSSNIKRMITLEKAMRKAGKGTGAHYILSAEWKELRRYNIALGSI